MIRRLTAPGCSTRCAGVRRDAGPFEGRRSWRRVRRSDGLTQIEVVDHRAGTAWVPRRLAELCERHEVDQGDVRRQFAGGVAGEGLLGRGVTVEVSRRTDHAIACGKFAR
jgi:hypothetical protein